MSGDLGRVDEPARVVVVTGAGRGLGLLTAEALLRRGDVVVTHYRTSSEDLKRLEKEFPGRVHPVQGDLADPATSEAIVRAATALGSLDAVVHNAGTAKDGPLVSMPIEDFDHVLGVNLRSAFLLTKAALRPMMRRKRGRFVYVSSVVAQMGNQGQAAYAASKAALQGFSISVAQEYARWPSRPACSTSDSPGPCDRTSSRRRSTTAWSA